MTFDEIKASGNTSVVFFYGAACGPCARLKPVMKDMAASQGFTLHEINVASEMDAVRALGIRGVPTIVAIKDGAAEVLFTGEQSRPNITRMLHSAGVLTY